MVGSPRTLAVCPQPLIIAEQREVDNDGTNGKEPEQCVEDNLHVHVWASKLAAVIVRYGANPHRI